MNIYNLLSSLPLTKDPRDPTASVEFPANRI